MSSSVPAQQGGMIVVTQIDPSPPQGGFVSSTAPQKICLCSNRVLFFALGIVQIIIGLTGIAFAVIMVTQADVPGAPRGAITVVTFFYIISGMSTVTVGNSSDHCKLGLRVSVNLIATVIAGTAIILYIIDAAETVPCYDPVLCDEDKTFVETLSVVLAVLHGLEFLITIVASVLICKSMYDSTVQQPSANIERRNASMAPPSYSASTSMVQLPPQMRSVSNPADGQSSPELTDPPPYSEAIKMF